MLTSWHAEPEMHLPELQMTQIQFFGSNSSPKLGGTGT